MSLPQFKLLRPHTLLDAVGMLQEHSGNLRILAGGTDLLPSMRQKLFEPEYVLDLRRIDELRGIRETEQGIERVERWPTGAPAWTQLISDV